MTDIEFGWTDASPRIHHGWLTPALRPLLPDPASHPALLDMGCGNGVLADRYRGWGFSVVGTEISEEGLGHARSSFPEVRFEKLSAYSDHRVLAPPGGFDVVVSCEVIEHLLTPADMLRRAFDALRPGGVLVLSTPYHGYWKNLAISLRGGWDVHWGVARDGWHIKFFSRATLLAMLEDVGFEVQGCTGAGRFPWLWRSLVVRATRP